MAEFADPETRNIVSFNLLAVLPDIGVEPGNLLLYDRTNSRISKLLVLEV